MSTNRLSLNALIPSVLMMLGACATHQDLRDPANDTEVQIIKQETKEEVSLLPRDLSLLTLSERNDKELLQNLENEIHNDALRMPATTEVEKLPGANSNRQYTTPIALSAEEMSQLLFNAENVTLQKGDTLSGLAEKHLGNKKEWNRIWALNPNIQNPNTVEVGLKVYIPKNDGMRNMASTQEAAKVPAAAPAPSSVMTSVATPAATTPVAPATMPAAPIMDESKTSKKIPELKPEVQAKAAPAKSFATEKAPLQEKTEEKKDITLKAEVSEAPAPTPTNWNSFHTKEELLQEHVSTKNQNKNAPTRSVASTQEAPESEATTVAPPKNLTRIVGFMGFALFLAVMGGFFFSKPNKNS